MYLPPVVSGGILGKCDFAKHCDKNYVLTSCKGILVDDNIMHSWQIIFAYLLAVKGLYVTVLYLHSTQFPGVYQINNLP